MNSIGSTFGPPPPGMEGSRIGLFLGCLSILQVIASAFYCLRIYSRVRPVIQLSWDDFFITLAFVCSLVGFGINCKNAALGYGHHMPTISLDNMVAIMRLNFYSQLLLAWSVTFSKMSVAFLLIRIQRSKTWIWTMIGANVILLSSVAVFTGLTITECSPVSAFWNRIREPQLALQCNNPTQVGNIILSASVVVIASDVFFSLTPLTFIFKIHRPLREKIVLSSLMAMGLAASIASIVRLIGSTQIKNAQDLTWDSVPYVILGFVEEYPAIIAACVPCLRALFERALRHIGLTITTYGSKAGRSQNTTRQASSGWAEVQKHGAPSTELWHEDGKTLHPEDGSTEHVIFDPKDGR